MSTISFRLCSGWSNLSTKPDFKGRNTIERYRFFSVRIFWNWKIVAMPIRFHRFYLRGAESIVRSCRSSSIIQLEFIQLCCNSMMRHLWRCIISFTISLPTNCRRINRRKKWIRLRKMERIKVVKILMILWHIFKLKIKIKVNKIWIILMRLVNFLWRNLKRSLSKTNKNLKML